MSDTYLDKNGLSYFWSKIKAKLSTKQDTLTPGEGITISDNVISSTGGSGGTAITDSEIDDLWGVISGPGATTKDYIVEEGTSGIWTYRKWASGIAECWQTANDAVAFNGSGQKFGSGFYKEYENWEYPSGLFMSAPTINATVTRSGGLCFIQVVSNNKTGMGWRIANLSQDGSVTTYFNFYIKGFWKTFTPPIAASEDKLQADYIIEEGNANGWDYRKWASGTAECWQLTGESAFSYTSTYGNGFFRDSGNWHYPTDLFVSAPAVKITPIVSQGLIFATVYSNNKSYCKVYTASLKSETNLKTAYSNYR